MRSAAATETKEREDKHHQVCGMIKLVAYLAPT